MRYRELVEADLNAPLNEAIDQTQLRRHDKAETGFAVLHHDAMRHDRARPLVIVVHPGDLIEPPQGWDDQQEYQEVRQFSLRNQQGTAKDVRAWRSKGADVVVLHRSSCTQFDDQRIYKPERRYVCYDLILQLDDAWGHGSILFGDDLEAAVAWMIEHLDIKNRPRINLAGAYSSLVAGCLTFIGQEMAKIVGPHRITVSKWSPGGNSADASQWRPKQRSVRSPTHK